MDTKYGEIDANFTSRIMRNRVHDNFKEATIMTRTYYESEIFRSFNAAYKMKRNLKTKFKIHCNLIYDGELSDPKNCRLTVTSVNDETKKELEKLNFRVMKNEVIGA